MFLSPLPPPAVSVETLVHMHVISQTVRHGAGTVTHYRNCVSVCVFLQTPQPRTMHTLSNKAYYTASNKAIVRLVRGCNMVRGCMPVVRQDFVSVLKIKIIVFVGK